MQFLLDYPLGKKLQRHLEFYVAQLSYEHETGRESALEMLAMVFAAFPLVGHTTLPFKGRMCVYPEKEWYLECLGGKWV